MRWRESFTNVLFFLGRIEFFFILYQTYVPTRKIGPRKKLTTYKNESGKIRNVCLSITSGFCLLLYVNMPDVTAGYGSTLNFFCLFFWKYSQIIDDNLCLNFCIFTKLSEIMWLINTQNFGHQQARCKCRLWKVLLYNYIFAEQNI